MAMHVHLCRPNSGDRRNVVPALDQPGGGIALWQMGRRAWSIFVGMEWIGLSVGS
jgi:hypothetical protein